jgi:hypothetical protein
LTRMRRVGGRASDPVPRARLMQDPASELRRIPLLGTSVNRGKKRKDRARRGRSSGVLVENKDSGPPFRQGESLLL